MANQDPQPEIYTTRYNFNADTGAGGATIAANTSQVVSIYTNQANNEEVRILRNRCSVLLMRQGTT